MTDSYEERNMILALQVLQTNPQLQLSRVARIYRVPRTTLNDRRAGIVAKYNTLPKSRKLTILEEEVVIRHILELDSRAFPPRRSAVEDMANRLLAERNGGRVGKNWTSNFVRRQPQLCTRFNRKIDYYRVQCEDPNAYNAWFRLVRNMINKYRIHEEDIYNFNETGFLMG
jgi:hypothetical protein